MNVETYRKREARLRIKQDQVKQKEDKKKKLEQKLEESPLVTKSPLVPKALKKTTTVDENSTLI